MLTKEGVKALRLVNDIANILDGKEWNADTCNEIADELRNAGFTIRDPDEMKET